MTGAALVMSATENLVTPPFDPRLPELHADPFPIFRRLQDEDPVHWSPILKGWVLTRYAHVKTALTDGAFSADRITPLHEHLPETARTELRDLFDMVGGWAVFKDPPLHTRLRGLMSQLFTQRAIEGRTARIQATIDALIDRAAASGRMDVIADFAYPLPAIVILELLGVPTRDLDLLKRWSDDFALFVGSDVSAEGRYDRAQQAARSLFQYFEPIVRERRARPCDDALSALVTAEGGDLSDRQAAALGASLMFAGHETTTNLIGNGLLALLRHPEALSLLGERPDLAAPAVEEMLRYDGPLGAMTRIVAEPVELGGVALRPGDRVFAFLNAAGRDGRRFADPDRFDLTRSDNAHLSFGHGIHYCLGAPLARLEARLAFTTLLRRLSAIEIEGAPLEWLSSVVFRGVRSLPIIFRASG